MTKKYYQCVDCEKVFEKRKEVKKLNGGCVCLSCARKRTKKKRDILLHEVIGVRRRKDLEIEWKKKREQKEKEKLEREPIVIRGAKTRKKSIAKYRAMGLYLTKDEKYVLYLKLKAMGLQSKEINERIKKNIEKINEITKKMREKNKTEEEINNKFKEEFAKLCEGE